MTVKEIQFNTFCTRIKQEYAPLTREQWEAIASKWATKPNRDSTSFYGSTNTFTCFSKKLRTLGCNEAKATQMGKGIQVSIYQDATNTRTVKYFEIGD